MARELTSRFAGRIRWIGFENQSGQDIPPYSIVEASGWQMPDPSGSDISVTSPVILADHPEDPINPHACYITGAGTVPAGGNGACAQPTLELPLLVALSGPQQDNNDAPFRLCGPSNGNWTATRDMPGLAMVDLPQQGYALVVPSRGPYLAQLGTGDAQSPSPPSGVGVNIIVTTMWSFGAGVAIGNETATSATLTIYNRFSPIGSDGRVLFDWTGQGWEVVESANAQLFVRGVLQGALAQGGSAMMKVTTNPNTGATTTITVNEVLGLNGGTISAKTNATACFNSYTGRYEVVSTGCVPAS
jgi:hypothetical protein